MLIATSTGMVGAIVVGLFGLFAEQSWLLLMIAIFGYLTCYQTRRMLREHGDTGVGEFGYDSSGGYTSLDDGEPKPRRPGFFERRRLRKQAASVEQERQRIARRQKEVERLLRKISETGMASLTPRERRVLEEETERQRKT